MNEVDSLSADFRDTYNLKISSLLLFNAPCSIY